MFVRVPRRLFQIGTTPCSPVSPIKGDCKMMDRIQGKLGLSNTCARPCADSVLLRRHGGILAYAKTEQMNLTMTRHAPAPKPDAVEGLFKWTIG